MTPEIARLLRIATYASVATASILIVAKLAAWLLTGSVSVLASLVDSLMDAGASLVNLFAVRYSLMPADDEHRFGHGKAEALAGLGQATFIVGSAVFLVLHAIDRLLHPQPLAQVGVGLAVMLFAIVATLILLLVQHHVIRRTHSTAIRADALHYATDLATNSATVASTCFDVIFNSFAIVDICVVNLPSRWILNDTRIRYGNGDIKQSGKSRCEPVDTGAVGRYIESIRSGNWLTCYIRNVGSIC